ncbi:MAG: hypothetical protein D6719_06235 [Candidatus Dadabacteria bacterium]|nr:MAG: hypothetical protein D6719_06235 [Candidatus Dadabacteria bacterium]
MARGQTARLAQIDVDAAQLFDGQGQRGTPERNLLMAVLERAILDFVGNDPKEAAAAEEWLFGEAEHPPAAFTLPWVCLQLDLDIKRVREIIKAMPKRGKHRIAPWYFAREQFLNG